MTPEGTLTLAEKVTTWVQNPWATSALFLMLFFWMLWKREREFDARNQEYIAWRLVVSKLLVLLDREEEKAEARRAKREVPRVQAQVSAGPQKE